MKTAVLDDWHAYFETDPAVQRLRARSDVRVYTRILTDGERPAELTDIQIAVALRERTRFDEAFFADAPSLLLISQTGRPGPHLDLQAATRAGVVVTATPRTGTSKSTVELTFGLMMAVMRRIPEADRTVREGGWVVPYGRVLHDKTLGIVGFGRIGSEVARIGRAFGMEVIAWSRNLTEERAAEAGVKAVSLEDVLQSADVVSVHLLLNRETRGILTRDRLALMKPAACFINTARGPLADEAALVDLLRGGKIAGAGLDVFEQEPLPPDSPFLGLPNVVLTPHIGWPTDDNYPGLAESAVANIEAYLDGKPVNVVNPEALAHPRQRRS